MKTPKFGRYVIESEIGRGAMGVVYKATDPMLERPIAIKTINIAIDRTDMKSYEARFYQEARAAGGLNHPNIVTVHDIGKSGETAYMAMEYIEGVELRALLGTGTPLGVAQAVSIAAQIAEGLAYAHERGIVHRDVKPANIMVVPNKPVKITDFGLGRMRASKDLTQTGAALGSPKYMSPEQVVGRRADHRSDIFSLGIILYEMLTGKAPFGGDSVTELMSQIVNSVPPPPSAIRPEVPELLDCIVAKTLAKPLEERYQGASEVARDLRECERQLAAPGTALASVPQPPQSGAAEVVQPSPVDADAKNVVLAQTRDRTRHGDEQVVRVAELPAIGVSQSFDSLEATQRLASLVGTVTGTNPGADNPMTATQALTDVRSLPRRRWRWRDWLLVCVAALLGLAAALAILKG